MKKFLLREAFLAADQRVQQGMPSVSGRFSFSRDGVRVVADVFGRQSGSLAFSSSLIREFFLEGRFRLAKAVAGGYALVSLDENEPNYWWPSEAAVRKRDDVGHIVQEGRASITSLEVDFSGIAFSFSSVPNDQTLEFEVWAFRDTSVVDELQQIEQLETQGYFVLGSHTRYVIPSDVYKHQVAGSLYENRYSWPHNRRIWSENDAHGLYLILNGLKRVTGKSIYELFNLQILRSVLSRQGQDGGFRHGEWTDEMESHYRLHCSAMHLMMDALAEYDDPAVRDGLERAAAFIADKHDRTDVGIWFFHDELETTEEGMRRAPFKWRPSRILGKAPQNMLVLNTQIDTLIALGRYASVTGDARYADLVESGFRATVSVLALRKAEWLYRLLFSAIDLTFLPTARAANLPLWQRMWKRVGWKYFVPLLPRLKTRFPRLVMPGGYIDRELSLQTWAFDYLAVNLMDLVRAARGHRRNAFMPYVDGILEHCTRTGVLRRWLETKRSVYAIGFFAEALILLNLDEPRPDADALLAEALLLCVREGIGLPPSINGGNSEFGASPQAIPQTKYATVVVANLCTPPHAICLVVNAGEEPVSFDDVLHKVPAGWILPNEPLAPGNWQRLQA